MHRLLPLLVLASCALNHEVAPELPEPDVELGGEAFAYQSCQFDTQPFVNPIVIVINPDGARECGAQVRLSIRDEDFIDHAEGNWRWSGEEQLRFGRSRRFPDEELRSRSLYIERAGAACEVEQRSILELDLQIAEWTERDFVGAYFGVLEDGSSIGGDFTGPWRTDISDCD